LPAFGEVLSNSRVLTELPEVAALGADLPALMDALSIARGAGRLRVGRTGNRHLSAVGLHEMIRHDRRGQAVKTVTPW
jgi:hypothetical protein